jgi:hypothetical protein
MYWKVQVTSVVHRAPGGEGVVTGQFDETFESEEDMMEWIESMYGSRPNRRWKGVYRDTPSGVEQVGYVRHYWSKDRGEAKSCWREDWITIATVGEAPYVPVKSSEGVV